jgi:hypothetical protein
LSTIAPARELAPRKYAGLTRLVHRVRIAIQKFNQEEQGMNTVEAIILLFVAAVVLVVFFLLIWPLIRDKVMEKLNELFGQSGQ